MKTVLLVRNKDEGEHYAREAGLQPYARTTIIVTPLMAASIDGLKFDEGDLVCEFPGFREHPRSHQVINRLTASMRKSNNAGPVWKAIDGKS